MSVNVTTENADEVARVFKGFIKEFAANEVKIKPAMVKGNRALALHYIDSRLVMDRLDEVVGINNWCDEYTVLPNGQVECRLSVRIAGEWITKADVGGQSDQPDEGDQMKAAFSDALKRAAVKFGVGRFLYRIPQQWLDYDPVKKCIIRPTSGSTKAPTPAKPAAAPVKAEDKPLVDRVIAAVKSAKSREDSIAIWRQYDADRKQGMFSDAEINAIDIEFSVIGKKYPPNQVKPAVANPAK